MHPTLIKANIALFRGVSSETRRLLNEYVAEVPEAKDSTIVLWLSANSEAQQEARIAGLRKLAARKPQDDTYVQLAGRTLAVETRFEQPEKNTSERTLFGIELWKVGAFVGAGIVIAVAVFGILSLVTSGTPTTIEATATATEQVQQVALATPLIVPTDQMVALQSGNTVSYDEGDLTINTFVSQSQRVVTLDESQVVTPIPGAQYFAFNVTFECKRGICDAPPEAILTLILNSGLEVSASPNVKILGDMGLSAVAANTPTTGWVIFEVPGSDLPKSLAVSPILVGAATEEPTSTVPIPLS